MTIRAFRAEDAGALVAVAKSCARGETDFVLVPSGSPSGTCSPSSSATASRPRSTCWSARRVTES